MSKALRKLLAAADPLPWREDDCNFFSGPLSDERHAQIMKRIEGDKRAPHPDEDRSHPLGFVGNCPQSTDNGWNNAALVVAAVNALPNLLALAVVLTSEAETARINVGLLIDDQIREYERGKLAALESVVKRLGAIVEPNDG